MPTIDQVQDIPPRIEYTGTNGQTIYVYPFPIFNEADIVVEIDLVDLILNVDYTVTGVTDDNGGTVILTVATTGGESVILYRDTPIDRLTDYVENGDFLAQTVNNDFDRIILMIQELAENSLNINGDDPIDFHTEVNFFEQVTFNNFAPISNTLPTLPEHLLRLGDINPDDTTLASTFTKYPVIVTPGLIDLVSPVPFQTAIPVIDGVIQLETSGAYTLDIPNDKVILAEALIGTEIVELWINDLFLTTPGSGTDLPQGARGNPWIFTTCFDFVADLPYAGLFKLGDWIQVNGRTIEADGGFAMYQVTDVSPAPIRFNFENYIPVDGEPLAATLWAVLKEGKKRDFGEQAIEIIAHRSFNFMGVQNTSFNDGAAMKYNIQSLETDVQVTSDGELVRWHDTTVDAETDGTGAVKDLTYAYLRGLVINRVAGTLLADRIKISRFDEFVKFAKSVGARIYPEIKQYRTTADIQLMIDVIEAHQYESMTVMQSFIIDDLVEVRRINKRVGVGWLTVQIFTEQQYVDFDKLQKLKWADVLFQEGNLRAFPSNVTQIYDAGLGLAAWGLEDNTEINALLNVGVFRQMLDQPLLSASVRGLTNVNY